jgi:hypothetical protein
VRTTAKVAAKSDRSIPAGNLDRGRQSPQGLSDLISVEIKDLTCNAQFNFCLSTSNHLAVFEVFFDRSEFAHPPPPGFRRHQQSRVTNSRIKLSKIVAFANFRATKNPISAPTLNFACGPVGLAAFRTGLVHCRDKIECNLKSQKLEELVAFFRATPLFGGRCNVAIRFARSTGILNFLQNFQSPQQSRFRFLQPPAGKRDAESSKRRFDDKRNFQKSFVRTKIVCE